MALVRAVKTLVNQVTAAAGQRRRADQRRDAAANDSVALDRSRIATPKAALDALSADIAAFLATLSPVAADPVTNRATILTRSTPTSTRP